MLWGNHKFTSSSPALGIEKCQLKTGLVQVVESYCYAHDPESFITSELLRKLFYFLHDLNAIVNSGLLPTHEVVNQSVLKLLHDAMRRERPELWLLICPIWSRATSFYSPKRKNLQRNALFGRGANIIERHHFS